MKTIEQKLEEIIWYAANDDNELGRFTVEDIKLVVSAILTSPDIAVVEKRVLEAERAEYAWAGQDYKKMKDKLQKMQGVVEKEPKGWCAICQHEEYLDNDNTCAICNRDLKLQKMQRVLVGLMEDCKLTMTGWREKKQNAVDDWNTRKEG